MEQKIIRILSNFNFPNFVGVGSEWILMLIYRIRSLEKHSPLISGKQAISGKKSKKQTENSEMDKS